MTLRTCDSSVIHIRAICGTLISVFEARRIDARCLVEACLARFDSRFNRCPSCRANSRTNTSGGRINTSTVEMRPDSTTDQPDPAHFRSNLLRGRTRCCWPPKSRRERGCSMSLRYSVHAYAWTTSWSNDDLWIIDHAKDHRDRRLRRPARAEQAPDADLRRRHGSRVRRCSLQADPRARRCDVRSGRRRRGSGRIRLDRRRLGAWRTSGASDTGRSAPTTPCTTSSSGYSSGSGQTTFATR